MAIRILSKDSIRLIQIKIQGTSGGKTFSRRS